MKKWRLSLAILSFLFLLLGVFLLNASADKKELEEIRSAIKESNAKWEADETSVSLLNPHERKKLSGTIIDKVPPGQDKAQPNKPQPPPPPQPDPSLPIYWNWLALGKVTPIKNQASCGSCWAFGSIAALESAYLIATGNMTDLAEQDLVSCCNYCWGDPAGGCEGGYMYKAYDYLRDTGAISEECFPYVAQNISCNYSTCLRAKISGWLGITPDLQALQRAVYEQPIPAAFYVYNDFYYYKSGVYSHVEKGKPKPPVGGHAICIIGWDNSNSCLIVKNSWGTGWGEDGFFRIAYTEIYNSVQFGRAAANYENIVLPQGSPSKARFTIATMWGQMKT